MSEEQEVIENDDEGVEVEIEAPQETDQVTEVEPVEQESAPVDSSGDDELESYSTKVQSRIKKLTERYRKEERDREEAVRLAQQLLTENQSLKSRVQNLDEGYLSEYGTRLDAQVDTAKRLYKEAYDSGDTDKMFDAQEALSKMSIEQERLRLAKQRSEHQMQQEQYQQEQYQQAPVQQPAAKPDPKAQGWAEKNEWFGSDEVMTYAAFGIHRKLVEEEGFDPASEEYYTEVDRRMRSEFPNKFQTKKSSGAQVASAGASASRSTSKSGRRSVKLSPSQIAMAKRLNVPLEEYAKFVKD
jgi:hypothetical protein